jgi:hypothetical protein
MFLGDTPPPTDTPATEHDELFGDIPKPAADSPPKTAAERLFSVRGEIRSTVRAREEDAATILGLSQEQRQARNREFLAGIEAAGLNSTIANPLYDALTTAEIADKRGELLDPATVQQAQEAYRRQLRASFGDRAERIAQATDAFIAEHPALARMLSTRNIGLQPDLRLLITNHVRKEKFL